MKTHPDHQQIHHDHKQDHHDHNDHTLGHHHAHGHHAHSTIKNLKVAFFLNFGFALLEIIGGLWTGSVAILSDAIHDLGDALALLLSIGFEKVANKRATSRFSYGFRRFSLLSALLTNAFLIAVTSVVIAQAIPRLLHPTRPKAEGMIFFALLGICVNGYAAWRLIRGNTMNEKVASWHLLEDVLGWVTVLLGACIMLFFDLPIIDPILSLIFSLFILWNVGRNLKQTIHLFLQGIPHGFDLPLLRSEIESLPGVIGTHDAHLWSLDGESHVLTIHVVVEAAIPMSEIQNLKNTIRGLCSKRGKIHVTVEVETADHVSGCPALNCV